MSERDVETNADEARSAALMELLYGEGAGVGEPGAPELPAEDAEALAAFKELRPLLRELPEHEPPARLSAQLLAAAAAEVRPARRDAPASGEQGLWARLLRPLLARPAVAAAASLTLVAGVAGVLYVGGSMKAEAPPLGERPSLAPAAAGSEEAATNVFDPAQPAVGAPGQDLPEEPAPPADEAPAKPDRAEGAAAPSPAATSEAPRRAPSRRRKLEKVSPEAAIDRLRKARTLGTDQSPAGYGHLGGRGAGTGASDAAGAGASRAAGAASSDDADAKLEAEAKSASPPRSRVRKQEEHDRASASAEAEKNEAPSQAPAPSAPEPSQGDVSSQVRALHTQARAAAEAGDCDRALALAAKIRKLDASYYQRAVAGDTLLRRCGR